MIFTERYIGQVPTVGQDAAIGYITSSGLSKTVTRNKPLQRL